MSKYTSREFLLAFIAAIVGVVKLFVSVDDSIVEQVSAVVVIIVPAVAYAIVRTVQKGQQPPQQ